MIFAVVPAIIILKLLFGFKKYKNCYINSSFYINIATVIAIFVFIEGCAILT